MTTADGPTIDRRGLVTTIGAALLGTAVGSGTAGAASEDVGPTVYVGTNWRDDGLYAIDADTGEERWRYGEGLYTPYSAPTVVDGTIYVGYDGTYSLHAIDATTGTTEWTFETGDWVRSAPTVVDGTVYVGSHDEHLYAIDAETGEKRWRFHAADRVHHGNGPTVIDGVVYTGTREGPTYAIDAESGDRLWTYEAAEGGGLTVYDDTVYLGSNSLHAIDAETGDNVWTYTDADGVSTPTVVDETVYVGTGGDDRTLAALSTATGEPRWRSAPLDGRVAAPTLAADTLFAAVGSSLRAFDPTDGDPLWEFTEPDRLVFVPTAYDGTVYIGSKDNTLYAVDADTGDRVWRFEGASHFVRTPTVVDASTGDSVDSRVMLGTLGHHDAWANDHPSADTEPSLEDYADEQTGQIETAGVIAAAGDWQAGEIGTSLLLAIFTAWQHGETIV